MRVLTTGIRYPSGCESRGSGVRGSTRSPRPALQRNSRLIAVQFFLGMWLNLFGIFPGGSAGLGATLTYTADPVLVAHIVLGVILVVGALSLLGLAWWDPLRATRWFAVGGLLGLIFAAATGSGFVYSPYSNDADSFLMAVGFAIALTAYYEGLVRLHADRLLRSPPRLGPTPG